MAHVETSAVRHAHLKPPHASRGAAFNQRLEARQQRLAPLDAESLPQISALSGQGRHRGLACTAMLITATGGP